MIRNTLRTCISRYHLCKSPYPGQAFRSNFFHAAIRQPQHPVAPPRERNIVGGDQRGQLMIAMQACNQLEHRVGGVAVQVPSRFIGQQKLRLSDERAGQRRPLLLSAGKLSRPVMRPLRQPNFLQPRGCFFFRLRLRSPSHQQRHGHIFQRRKLRQQIMELPNKSNFAIAKIRCCVFRQRTQPQVGAVYVT